MQQLQFKIQFANRLKTISDNGTDLMIVVTVDARDKSSICDQLISRKPLYRAVHMGRWCVALKLVFSAPYYVHLYRLRFYVTLDTQWVILEKFFPANLLAKYWKLNLTQQKQMCIRNKIYTNIKKILCLFYVDLQKWYLSYNVM